MRAAWVSPAGALPRCQYDIRALARVVHARLLAMLEIYPHAFCDESADERKARVWVAAGYFGSAEEWERFALAWDNALRDEDCLPAFHMVDCESGSGDFKGKPLEKRERLQRRFIDIVTRSKIKGAAVGIMLEPYNRLLQRIRHYRHIPQGLSVSGSLADPYFWAFQHLVELIATDIEICQLPPEERVAFTFDQHQMSGRAQALYDSVLHSESFQYRSRLGAIAFDDRRRVNPLQAADIIAYECRRHLNDSLLDGKPERWQWSEVKKRVPNLQVYDKEQLEFRMNRVGWT
jgi:hypothetical protein